MPLLFLRRDDDDHPTTATPRHFHIRLDAIDLRAGGATQPVIRFTAPARRDHRKRVRRVLGSEPGHGPWAGLGPLVRDEGDFRVHGSCDGVLLVSYKSVHYLCNPARRRWDRVSALTSDGIVGFYAHRPSGEFRVLCLRRSIGGSTDVDYDYRIMTLGRPATFRRIAGGPHSDEMLAAIRARPASEAPPAIVAGNLHWLPRQHPAGSSGGDLLVFDPVSETFRRMRRPDGQAQALLEIDGKLTLTITRGDLAAAELWVLQDYETQDSWVRELRIPLPPPAADIAAVAVVSPEGDVLVHCTNSLLQCDATGRVRMRHQQPEHHRIIAVPHMFRESLVPHGHVDGRDITTGYEGIRYPPFIKCNCQLHTELSSRLEPAPSV